jgi:futalosine hydrolase
MQTLLIVAAPAEACAVLHACDVDPSLAERQWEPVELTTGLTLLITGIGKVNAAGAVARFAHPSRCARIVSLGLAGILPGAPLDIGDAVAASASIYADEGLLTPDGFLDCAAMGFPPLAGMGSAFPAADDLLGLLAPLVRMAAPIATVSTCSGTDELAAQVGQRTGAVAECMEGAAIAHVARRLGIPHADVRIISNTTGERARQRWGLRKALDALEEVTGPLCGVLRPVD